jgi:hypothetical protein
VPSAADAIDAPDAKAAADAETAATPSTPPSGAVAPGDMDLDRLVAGWPSVVALLSRQPAVKQLILTCRPVALDGAIVTLGFPEEQAFLRDIAERKRGAIEAGIAEVVGREVTVRCVVANIEVAPLPATDDLVAEARRIFGEDLVDVGEVN